MLILGFRDVRYKWIGVSLRDKDIGWTFLYFLLFREKEEAAKDAESGEGMSNEETKSGGVSGRGDDDEDDVTNLYDLAHYDSDEDVEGNALSFLNKYLMSFCMSKVNEYSGTCLPFSHLVITGVLIN